MFDDASLDAADRWVDDWQVKIEERLARSRALAASLGAVAGTARSGDGLVEVTVDSSGALQELHLDEDVRGHSARWIAEQVLATARAARADLARRSIEVAEQSGDADSAVLSALTARLGEVDR